MKKICYILYYLCWFVYPFFLLSTYFLLPIIWKASSGVDYFTEEFYSLDLYHFINPKITHLLLIALIYVALAISVLFLVLWLFELGHAIRTKTFQVVLSKYSRIRGVLVWGYFLCVTLICCLLRLFFEYIGNWSKINHSYNVGIWYNMGAWYTVGMYFAIILIILYLLSYPAESSDRNVTVCRILLGIGAPIYLLKNILYGYVDLNGLIKNIPEQHRFLHYTCLTYLDNICFFTAFLIFLFRPYTQKGKWKGVFGEIIKRPAFMISLLICILILCFVPLHFEYYHYGMIISMGMGIYFISRYFDSGTRKQKENQGKKRSGMLFLGITLIGIACFVYVNMCAGYKVWGYEAWYWGGEPKVPLFFQWLFPIFEWILYWRSFY